MTTLFIENESYKHKMAKEVLKKWFENESEKKDYRTIGDISFRPNRHSGIFLEYPICKGVCGNYDNSWLHNWDEICLDGVYEYVPTYDECINKYDSYPIAIIDMVGSHKGSPSIGIEICHKNPVSQEKINKLKEFGVCNLIEIDADWILNQTKIPSQLKYKRLI
jgi:hypothetical protein